MLITMAVGDIQVDLKSQIYLFQVIPIEIETFYLTQLQIQIELGIETIDNVHYLLQQETTVSI